MEQVSGARRRRAIGLTVVAAAFALLLATGSAEAKGGSKLFGLDFSFHSLSGKDASKLDKSGSKTVRWTFLWPRIEPTPGQYNWTDADNLVGDLASRGIHVVPTIWGSPKWVASAAVKPPLKSGKDRDAWKGFLRQLVNRYGPSGSYWTGGYQAAHPGKPPLPIKIWQIWNEPNLQGAMKPPDPALYARLLKISHTAIHDADSKAKVMFAGMPGYSGDINAWDFLKRVYKKHGAAKDFDIAALHPYARTVHQMLGEIKRLRHVMDRNGDRRKPLWITEIGWGSLPKNATPFGLTKGKKGQKRMLKHAFHTLKKKRHSLHIQRVLWFNFRDPGGGGVKTCSFCSSAGLLKNDYKPKPAWNAFRKFTGARH